MFIITCFGSLLYFFLISYIFLSAVNSSTAAVMVFIPFLLPTRASIIKILQIKITRMAIHLAHFGTKKLLTWYISPKLQNRINDHYKHYVSLPNTLPSFSKNRHLLIVYFVTYHLYIRHRRVCSVLIAS